VGRGLETALLFHVITLGPLLGFFMLATFKYSFVADHYQYVACIGPLALIAAWVTTAFRGVSTRAAVAGALVLVLGALTFHQTGIYHDRETLWRATVDTNPESFMAQNNLAIELLGRGQIDEAIGHYEKAVELEPGEALTRLNLGKALTARGRVDEAISHLRKAMDLQPDGASIAFALGNALVSQGRLDEAIAYYQKSAQLQPDSAAAANTLGSAWLAKGDVEQAISWFSKALALSPTMAKAHANLAGALVRERRFADASSHLQMAVELQPTNVANLNNLAWLLATCPEDTLRNGKKAVAVAEQANELTEGRSADVLVTLAAAYAETERFGDAKLAAQRALETTAAKFNPGLADSIKAKIKLFESRTPFRTP
jgi:tetratricopeptide (TPR) repeat protein